MFPALAEVSSPMSRPQSSVLRACSSLPLTTVNEEIAMQEGTITEYPEGAEASNHAAGQAVAVGLRTRHWEENQGPGRVIVIAVDIIRK